MLVCFGDEHFRVALGGGGEVVTVEAVPAEHFAEYTVCSERPVVGQTLVRCQVVNLNKLTMFGRFEGEHFRIDVDGRGTVLSWARMSPSPSIGYWGLLARPVVGQVIHMPSVVAPQ